MQIEEMEKTISNFQEIENQLFPNKTFFEIAGFPSRENVFSNILKFYLDTREKHHLGASVIKALLQEVKLDIAEDDLITIQIRREVTTTKYNRIDLVIETKRFLIGIENKVYHSLQNDLTDYADFLDKQSSKEKIFIVLNLHDDKSIHEQGFKAVSYMGFVSRLENNIPSLTDNKYEVLLKEFIQNIKNHFPQHMTKEQIEFYIVNEDQIKKISELAKRIPTYLDSRLSRIHNLIVRNEQWETYCEIPTTYEYHLELLNDKYLKLACTIEIEKFYFEAWASDRQLMDRLKYCIDSKFSTQKSEVLNGWIYLPSYSGIYDVRDEQVAADFSKLLAIVEEFILVENSAVATK